ncbi:hypothetical protein [Pseudoduganella sp. HUAS MS19]
MNATPRQSDVVELDDHELLHVAGGPEVGNDPGHSLHNRGFASTLLLPEEGNDPGHD